MKKFIILFLLILNGFASMPQTPYTFISSGNTAYSSGNTEISANQVTAGNTSFKVSSSAEVTLKALSFVDAKPGFEATAFSPGGFSHLVIDPNILDLASFHTNGFSGIPQYDRFEIGIKIPDNIQNQINTFLSSGNGLNPYNPDKVTVFCQYNSSNTTYYRNGFYYKDFSEDLINNTWTDNNTDYTFRIRFAPPQVGTYQATVFVLVNNVLIVKKDFGFAVVPSSNPGHLRVDGSLRKLRFENGSVFFGIGENIPWASNLIGNAGPIGASQIASPSTHNVHRTQIQDLATNKGNFVRIGLEEWSVPIETQNYIPNIYPANLADCLNNYEHNQTSMWEMDQTLALCEDKNSPIYIDLNLQIEGMFSETDDWHQVSWIRCPYSTLWNDPTVATEVQKFFTQTLAKDYYKKRLRYIEARWGYSTSIAMWEMLNEPEGMNNFTAISQDIANWVCEMANYIKGPYPNHLTTTGTARSNGLNPIIAPLNCLDVYNTHVYEDERNGNNHENKKDNLHEELTSNFNAGKLFFYGELGYPDNADGVDIVNDRNFHNSIWATAMGGGISTGLNFHDWDESSYVKHRINNFPAMRVFMNNVDFTQVLVPIRFNPPNTLKNRSQGTGSFANQEVFTYYMSNSNSSHIAGWAFTGACFWANDPPTSFDDPNRVLHPADPNANPPQQYIPNFNWLNTVIPTNTNDYDVQVSNISPVILLKNLPTGKYHIDIYKTYDAGGIVGTSDFCLSNPQDVEVRIPFVNHPTISGGFNYPDYAFIVTNMWEDCNSEGGRSAGGAFVTAISLADRESVTERIYPVPASNAVYIDINNTDWINPKVYIIDALGKEYGKEIGKEKSVDLTEFSNGFYTLKIKDEKHQKLFKIVVQH